MSESVIPSDIVANDVDVTGVDALDAPVVTASKSELGAPISCERVDELPHDNPESTATGVEKATENLSPGTKGGFDSETREAIQTVERAVVKTGFSPLTGSDGHTDPERIDFIANVLEKRMGVSDVIVVFPGAVASGMGPLELTSRPSDLVTKQAAATVGQMRLAQEWGRSSLRYGRTPAQVLLTSDDAGVRSRARNTRHTIDRPHQLDAVPIISENDTVAISEFRFGDNDRLAALASCLVHCDTLTLLSDVGGLYDCNPASPGITLMPEMRSGNDLRGVIAGDGGALGTGGMVSKVSVACLVLYAGVPVSLTSASDIERALNQVDVGTALPVKENRLSTWKLWMLCAVDSSGLLRLDAGAVDTVTRMRKPLLPVGTTAIDDELSTGDIVDLIGPSGEVIGRGKVNYDSEELLGMIGYHTEELPNDMQKPIVHTDYLSDFAFRAQEGIALRAAAPKDVHTRMRPDRNVPTKSS